ncbi:hypothetical protein [Alteraurantiacibacter aquimixticola]|uniref:Uncharacterized protein n=1 Tax=Alteraurantiacibacter aquimixticola TaxID=2489173 RepID=A0A4T3F4U8_9SPHN|nr:hypothetical protein [Alteraurantiacibacter aquimixticola]TIX51384.1 hypothetical protein E5222_02660 [Alteraurantiacibacter aquimixticola]
MAAPEPIPYRPIPPRGAAYQMEVPPVDAFGQRLTVNTAIDESETVWHFRSGWNVAALNCLAPGDEIITSAYGEFLRGFPNGLRSANQAIDRKFREDYSSSREALLAREEHATQVYNYFAMPGARADFCAAARVVAGQFANYEGDNVKEFAAANLPLLENAFLRFFEEYEEYERLSADWDSQYGTRYGQSQPGYVAIYGNGLTTVGSTLASQQEPAGAVIDVDTGAAIPVIPVDDGNTVSTPVVQPLSNEPVQGTSVAQ